MDGPESTPGTAVGSSCATTVPSPNRSSLVALRRSVLRSVLHGSMQAGGTVQTPRENRADSRLADVWAGRGFEKKLACFGWWEGHPARRGWKRTRTGTLQKLRQRSGPCPQRDGIGLARKTAVGPRLPGLADMLWPSQVVCRSWSYGAEDGTLGGCSVPRRLLLMRRRLGERLIEITAHHSINGRRKIRQISGAKVIHTV